MPKEKPALTVGEIARRLDIPVHRVTYLLKTRDIRPTLRAGIARVFSEDDVTRLAAELDKPEKSAGGEQ